MHRMDADHRDWPEVQSAFYGAACWFADVVPSASGRWEESGLGNWTVRDLVGHTSRALVTVDSYLDAPADEIVVDSAGGYFSRVFAVSGDPKAVAQRGREAGRILGADPAEKINALVAKVNERVQHATGREPVTTPIGGMRLADYLPTRTFELTIHTLDLAHCLGEPGKPPAEAAAATWCLIGDLLMQRGELAGSVICSLTGRQPLPEGFSVLADH
jgi:uncharacterized protein (TIGR03083 family)